MKKKVRRFIVGGLVLLLAAAGLVVYRVDALARAGVETGAGRALGTRTTLDSASIGIVSGRSELAGFQVGNPPGFGDGHFLKLDQAAVELSLAALLDDVVQVPAIALGGIDLNLERGLTGSNYDAIIANLRGFESGGGPREGKRFVVREIVVRDVKVHVKLLPGLGGALTQVTVPIPELRLRDVGSDSSGGVILAQVTGALVQAILAATIENGGGLLPQDLLQDLGRAVGGVDSLKTVGATLAVTVDGVLKDVTRDVGAAAAAAVDSAVKNVGQNVQQATQGLEDAAKKTMDDAARDLGGLFRKEDPKRRN